MADTARTRPDTGGGITSPDYWEARWSKALADARAEDDKAILAHTESEWHSGRFRFHTRGAEFVSSGAGTFVGAKAHDSSGTVLNHNTATAVVLDVNDFDTDTMHSTSINQQRFTINTAGKYRVEASSVLEARFASPTNTPFYFEVRLDTNLAQKKYANVNLTQEQIDLGLRGCVEVDDIFTFNVGDYIEIHLIQNSGVQLETNAFSWFWTRMSVEKVG
jgi:hypothetical protein